MADIVCKIMGAIDVIAALIIMFSFSTIWFQVLAWILLIKGIISLLS